MPLALPRAMQCSQKQVGGRVVPRQDDVHERTHTFRAPLESVQIVTAEHVLHDGGPEVFVVGICPAPHARAFPVDIDGDDLGKVIDCVARTLQDARIDLHAAPPGRLDHFGEQVAIGIFELGVSRADAQPGIAEILIVVLHPDRRERTAIHPRRLAVIGGQSAGRLAEVAVKGMTVGEHGINVRGFPDQVKTRLDAFIEHRVRTHLDAVEECRLRLTGRHFRNIVAVRPGRGYHRPGSGQSRLSRAEGDGHIPHEIAPAHRRNAGGEVRLCRHR